MDHVVYAYRFGLGHISTIHGRGNPRRIFDPENDIYPPPLITSQPSSKVKSWDKLHMATMYFQYDRLKKLIMDHQDDYYEIKPEHIVDEYTTLKKRVKKLKHIDINVIKHIQK